MQKAFPMSLTAAEQYLLELTNRARLDPVAEAARYGISLNAGLQAGTIKATPKQALAGDQDLHEAADAHSAWMIRADVFSHTGSGGSDAGERMGQAGYTFSGSWSWGENLSWVGSSQAVNLNTAVAQHHKNLFLSAGHRVNTLDDGFREVGIGQVSGLFNHQGSQLQSSMTTLNFASTGSAMLVTGVAYVDRDANGFYSIGEGRSGVSFQVSGIGVATERTTTAAAGGYDVAVAKGSGMATVQITHGAHTTVVEVSRAGENVKLDLVGDTTLLVSGDTRLVSGPITDLRVLGAVEADLTGSSSSNKLWGNKANNILDGMGGNDTLSGAAGNDRLLGGDGNDSLTAGEGNDLLWGGSGADRLQGDVGHDKLYGGTGNDSLFGGEGNDRLDGSGNNDALVGNGGADVFVFTVGGGNDRVADFVRSQGDKVALDANLFDPGTTLAQIASQHTERTAQGLLLTTDDGDTLLFTGLTSLAASDLAWL
jgi:Ca2+-binding RTX toxin-like protein